MFPIRKRGKKQQQIFKLLFCGFVPNKSNLQKAYTQIKKESKKTVQEQEVGDEYISSPVGKLVCDGKVTRYDGRRECRRDSGGKSQSVNSHNQLLHQTQRANGKELHKAVASAEEGADELERDQSVAA